MNTTTILAVITAVAVVGAGASLFFLGGMDDEITTKVSIGAGLTCTINDKAVSNGDELVLKDTTELRICVRSADAVQMRTAGTWTSEKNTYGDVYTTSSPVKEACFTYTLNHGKFCGQLKVINMATDDGNDICPIHLKFSFDESKVKVSSGGTEIKNGDTFTFNGDGYVSVESKIGKANLSYSGSWKNADGMSGGANGYNLGTSVGISIMNMMFFSDGYGDMTITAKAAA